MHRYRVRSLLFSHYDRSLPNRYRKPVERALMLLSSEQRQTLEDAHVRHVTPFPRKEEEKAVEALGRALEILSPARAA